MKAAQARDESKIIDNKLPQKYTHSENMKRTSALIRFVHKYPFFRKKMQTFVNFSIHSLQMTGTMRTTTSIRSQSQIIIRGQTMIRRNDSINRKYCLVLF